MLPSQLQVCGVKSLTESKQNINIKLGSLSKFWIYRTEACNISVNRFHRSLATLGHKWPYKTESPVPK